VLLNSRSCAWLLLWLTCLLGMLLLLVSKGCMHMVANEVSVGWRLPGIHVAERTKGHNGDPYYNSCPWDPSGGQQTTSLTTSVVFWDQQGVGKWKKIKAMTLGPILDIGLGTGLELAHMLQSQCWPTVIDVTLRFRTTVSGDIYSRTSTA